jgi:tRNA pseudouridine55 synthase
VLPVCIGQATRIIQFIIDAPKTYLAVLQLGTATDTFDRQGKITHRGDTDHVTITKIQEALVQFTGIIVQTPPSYSALKQNGKRCYELARAGLPVNPKPRRIKISAIEIVDFRIPLLTIKVECSKGTYIRSLAQDIGTILGCYAHLTELTRLKCGPFSIENTLSLDLIANAKRIGQFESLMYAMDTPLIDMDTLTVSSGTEKAITNGQAISRDDEQLITGRYCRAYNHNGKFIAVLQYMPETGLLHPKKVFSNANSVAASLD